ncbi:hypothetical protein Cflav_PD4851 [Pedosphaera parvula Ellin514]|uniref:Uncharacterized protein n=1 Tax=Pedosphaera parvula (strain Ellin514) TaxID=320771 RepID=B9XEU7_PEDPL|nr:hypothetical protein Cflav_PD4851 [Pedosphaera parvula Ellin514]
MLIFVAFFHTGMKPCLVLIQPTGAVNTAQSSRISPTPIRIVVAITTPMTVMGMKQASVMPVDHRH